MRWRRRFGIVRFLRSIWSVDRDSARKLGEPKVQPSRRHREVSPGGWMAAKDTIMDDVHAPVRRALVENETLQRVHRETGRGDWPGEDAQRRRARICVGGQTPEGSETGLVAWSRNGVDNIRPLSKLTVEVPKLGSMFQRRQKVDELRAALKERGTGLGSSLDALATKLSATKHS